MYIPKESVTNGYSIGHTPPVLVRWNTVAEYPPSFSAIRIIARPCTLTHSPRGISSSPLRQPDSSASTAKQMIRIGFIINIVIHFHRKNRVRTITADTIRSISTIIQMKAVFVQSDARRNIRFASRTDSSAFRASLFGIAAVVYDSFSHTTEASYFRRV